jgi:hypothetical protein
MIPDPVIGAVSATLEKKKKNAPPEEYTGYYIETCVGVDEDFYNSPKKERLKTPRRDYCIDELAHRAKDGRSPEARAKSLERGLEDARREELAMEQEMFAASSTLERGRERERVNRARKQLMKEDGSQGSLDGSKERIKPAIARKPKISDKLRQEFRNSSQERPQTPTATDNLRQEFMERTGTTSERGASLEKKETPSGTFEMKADSTLKVGTVERTVVKTHQKTNGSSAIEVVELSDTSSTGSSRPGSRPGSAGASRPSNLGKTDDFMYNVMLQQSINAAVSRQGPSRSVPRDQTSSMDRTMTRDQPATMNKQMKRSQTSSMDRTMARKEFFEPQSERVEKYRSLDHKKDKANDDEKKEKGAHDRSSSYSSFGSDKDSPRTPVTAEVKVESSKMHSGPIVTGSAPANRSGPVIAGSAPHSVKIVGGPVISGHMPETAMHGSVERGDDKKRDGRIATPLVVTKTPEPGNAGTVERGRDLTKHGRVATPFVVTTTSEPQREKDGTQDRHFKKRNETATAYNERVKKSEPSLSFRDTETSDSFRTPNRELQYEMDILTASNNISSGSHKTPRRSASKERGLDEDISKSSSKDRRKKNRKDQIRREESFDSTQFSSVTMQSDRSDTTYGQDSMTEAVVRGAVRDTVHDNMFGQESTLSPVTPGTQWGMMEERFSTPKGKKDKKSKGGFFSFGSKRKPKRSRENSLDSTLDTTMDSTFDKKSVASMGSQDTLNETVKQGDRSRTEKKQRERSKDRTVKVKDKNRRVKEKEAMEEVTNQDMDSIQGIFIEGDDDLLKKEDMERIGQVPMEMTSTPDRQRKVKKKPKSGGKVEIIDMQESNEIHGRDRSRPPQDENLETEYTTTKDVMNAMFVGAMEGKKRSPRKKSRERKDRKDEEERLHVTEISIDDMLKERDISRAEKDNNDDRRRMKDNSLSRALKENSVDRRHKDKEHTISRPQKERQKEREGRHRVKDDETKRKKENSSRTRKDSDEERQIVKKTTTRSEKSGRYVKKKDKEPSDATRAIMSELLRQVGASPGNDYHVDEEGEREENKEVVYRKVVKKRAGRSEERRRQVKRNEERTEEFEYRNGDVSVQEGKRRGRKNDYVQNGDNSYEEYKVEWNEYPEDEFEKTSYSGFDVSLDEVIQERENRKSEVFRMLLEDTAFEKKLRRLAEKRAREAEKLSESGSEGTGSTSRSTDRSSESLDEVDLLRELEKRIEEYFERQKQKKIKVLLKKFMAEEGSRMSMLMSHTDEVLDLIALKVRENPLEFFIASLLIGVFIAYAFYSHFTSV